MSGTKPENPVKKVSVIIPVYNSELFIEQCVQSVTDQTYKNLEILIIDDGSADRSAEICSGLSAEDGRIKLVSQNHKGVSAARNYGLDLAVGEFVFFLDSDDAIHPLLMEHFVRQAERVHAAVVMCDYRKLNNRRMKKVLNRTLEGDEKPEWQIGEGEKPAEWFHTAYLEQMSGIGGKLIRRNATEDLRFDERLTCGEDTLFMYYLTGRQICMAYSPVKWYYYRQHDKSLSHLADGTRNCHYFECCKTIRDHEFRKGNTTYSLIWEGWLIYHLEKSFLLMKKAKRKDECQRLTELAGGERTHPLFRKLEGRRKRWFELIFSDRYPCQVLLAYLAMKERVWKTVLGIQKLKSS